MEDSGEEWRRVEASGCEQKRDNHATQQSPSGHQSNNPGADPFKMDTLLMRVCFLTTL